MHKEIESFQKSVVLEEVILLALVGTKFIYVGWSSRRVL